MKTEQGDKPKFGSIQPDTDPELAVPESKFRKEHWDITGLPTVEDLQKDPVWSWLLDEPDLYTEDDGVPLEDERKIN